MASPETGSEKHRDMEADVLSRFRRTWKKWVAGDSADDDDLLAALVVDVRAALARVEAETRREFEDERAALRAVLTPLRELVAKATPLPWRVAREPFRRYPESSLAQDIYPTAIPPDEYGPRSADAYEHRIGNALKVADAALVVALTDALPALLKLAEESAETEPQGEAR